ncbi:MAG: TetR family transcriptional regulator [Dehalococcoidia bacterium]
MKQDLDSATDPGGESAADPLAGAGNGRGPKSARTRQRILDAAASVFREQGYATARLSDIAERAGMQSGSLYYHFASREELVAEILHLGIRTAWGHVRAAVDALPGDVTPLDRVATAIRAHTMAILEISDYTSAQARIVGQVPGEVLRVHRVEQREYGEYWHGLIVAARDAGQLQPGLDLFTVRMLAFGAMNWTAEWYNPKRGADASSVADSAVAMVLNGITRRPA